MPSDFAASRRVRRIVPGRDSLRFFGAARGDPAEVCRIQRDARKWSITRFPMWAAVLNYRGSARGLRFTVSLRNGVGFLGSRKTADFLGDRTSVRVALGSGTAAFECGRKSARVLRNRSAAQKFFHR